MRRHVFSMGGCIVACLLLAQAVASAGAGAGVGIDDGTGTGTGTDTGTGGMEQAQAAFDRGNYAAARDWLQSRLDERPDDSEARFLLAQVYGRTVNHEAALAEYDHLLASYPDNVDYVFGRALVLNASGDVDGALAGLSRARALAPDYEDVWRIEHSLRVAHQADRPDHRPDYEAFMTDARLRFPEADWLAQAPAAAAIPAADVAPATDAVTQLIFGVVRESLTRPVPDWNSRFLELRRLRGERGSVYGRAQSEERFGRRDLLLGGGGDWKVSQRWRVGFDALYGSDNEFMPTWTGTGWASVDFADGWVGRFSLRHREYEDTSVSSTATQIGRYFGRFRAAYTLDLARLRGDSVSAAHVGHLNYFVSERTRLDLTVARGEEAEAIDANRVLRTDVRSVTVGVRQAIGDRWQIGVWTGTHTQGDLYKRRYVGFSLAAGL